MTNQGTYRYQALSRTSHTVDSQKGLVPSTHRDVTSHSSVDYGLQIQTGRKRHCTCHNVIKTNLTLVPRESESGKPSGHRTS